jgi:hypothetical protein
VYLKSIELNLHAGRVHALGDLVLVSLSYSAPLATDFQTTEQEALRISRNPEHHDITKHIAIKYHYLRNNNLDGQITTTYV